MTKISSLERTCGGGSPKNNSGEQAIIQIPSMNPLETINSFSIIPRIYEAELDKKYGIKLKAIRNGETSGFQGDLQNNVSFNGCGNYSVDQIDKKILKKYESFPDFCSMKIKNMDELSEHIKNIHELSYNHYVFGKEENLKGQFPNFCCGYSAGNLLLTLMEKGYPNASFFYNDYQDHAYNGLPFLFGDNKEKGFIIIDPTSDQLFEAKKTAPRNNLFIVSGTKWKYETDWNFGADLFPHQYDNSTFSNMHTLRKFPRQYIYEKSGLNKYFENVFKNAVEVKVESL